MNLIKISVFVFFYSLITNTYAVKIETDLEKLSYSMGIYFGQTVNSQEMEIDIPVFMQAVEDVLNNAEKKMTDGEMKKILSTYQKMEQDQRAAESDSNKIKGEKYLAENKDKEGVITLPSGLQYKIIKNSEGESVKPCSIHPVVLLGSNIPNILRPCPAFAIESIVRSPPISPTLTPYGSPVNGTKFPSTVSNCVEPGTTALNKLPTKFCPVPVPM